MTQNPFSVLAMHDFHQANMMRILTRHGAPITTAIEMAAEQALQRSLWTPQMVQTALSPHYDADVVYPAPEAVSEGSAGVPLSTPSRTQWDSKPNRSQRRAQQREFRSWIKQFERSMKMSVPLGAEEE